VTITGHGFGHGIGMPQYGAYGYALKTRHTDAYILAYFYPGTRLRTRASRPLRVLLKQGPRLLVSEAARLVAARRAAGRAGAATDVPVRAGRRGAAPALGLRSTRFVVTAR
jgi:hypothetical protein